MESAISMIRIFIILLAMAIGISLCHAQTVFTHVPNGGYIRTFYGTGYVVMDSTPMGKATPSGTAGQCIGLLCGLASPN